MYAKLLIITVLVIGVIGQDDLASLIKTIFDKQLGPPDNREQVIAEAERRGNRQNDNQLVQSNKLCGIGKKCVQEYLCSIGHQDKFGARVINVRIDTDDSNECPFLETCCSYDNIVSNPIVKPQDTTTGCGYRNVDGVGFKIDGATTEAEFGEFPWMLAILSESHIYKCGASLIHPQVVLTGAHCVYGSPARNLRVRAGEWETNSKSELLPDQDRLVVDMVIHEQFDNFNLRNDIALLFLESPFDLAPNVNTLCLPPAGYNFDFERCYASGWGKDQFQNGKYQNILKKLDLPIVPSYVCQDNLRQTRLGNYFELHSSLLCAGGEPNKDTCEGDGGSPLVCPIPNTEHRYYQAGVVAWGIGCGTANIPGVYANVAEFRSWIDQQFANRKIDSSYYTPS